MNYRKIVIAVKVIAHLYEYFRRFNTFAEKFTHACKDCGVLFNHCFWVWVLNNVLCFLRLNMWRGRLASHPL